MGPVFKRFFIKLLRRPKTDQFFSFDKGQIGNYLLSNMPVVVDFINFGALHCLLLLLIDGFYKAQKFLPKTLAYYKVHLFLFGAFLRFLVGFFEKRFTTF